MVSDVCPKCGGEAVRHDTLDAYACLKCDIWTETKCSDPKCRFCPQRPEKPSMADQAGFDED